MRKSFRNLILLSLVSLMSIFAGASMIIAFPSSTSECGNTGCHDTATLTITSNATGIVNATVGKSFVLNIDAGSYSGGDQEFYVSIQSSWADNNQFSFIATSIQDNGAGDLNSNLNQISISVDFTPISVGTFTLRIWTAGKSDVAGSLDVTVSVTYDENAPFIDSPTDIEYEYSATGNEITWFPSDPNPDHYSILRNGTIIGSGGWNGSSISIIVDWLIPGVYGYTLIVYNVGGSFASDTVIVTVTLPITTTGTSTTTTTTTTTSPETTTTSQTGVLILDDTVLSPFITVVGTWVGLILVVVVISEGFKRKGRW